MTAEQIIRAWRDEDFRASLTDAQRAELPANPVAVAGQTVDEAAGAADSYSYYTGTCNNVCETLTHPAACITI